jgi:hypothetical protein
VRGLLLPLWLLAACATPTYHVATLPPAWRQIRADADGWSWHHSDGGTIASTRTCDRADDVPLDVLTNHLLIGVVERHESARVASVVDGRAALRTQLVAKLDGVRVAMDLVVLKKDGCTYDLMLLTPPALAAARVADFDRFLAGFSAGGAP